MSDDSLAKQFVSTVRDYPERIFLRWADGRITWTYAEAAARVDALIAKLDALGVGRGDHVVVYTHAMVPSLLFDIACACAGIIYTPIETSSLPAVLDLIARTNAKAVLTTPERANAFDVAIAEDGRGSVALDPGVLARLTERASHIDGDATYMLQPTSGTTGGSKLVIRHHATFVRVGDLFSFGTKRTDEPPARVLMVPALTHGMGQYLLAIGLSLGAEFGVTTKIDVGADIEEIRWLDPTHMALTPRVLRSLVQQLGGLANITRIFGPSAKFMICSGAPPDKDVLTAVHASGVTVIEGYGASEISVCAYTRPGRWQSGLVGHILDDCKLRITDEGELLAWTPVMFRGYHGAPELTKKAFTEDGFYKTGDRVSISPDGEFRYLGRVVDTFNLFDGSNVAPGAIEDAMARLAWVDQVLLLGDQRPYITGLVVLHPALRGQSIEATIQRDVGAICAGFEPNARVRRLAIIDAPFPDDVYQIVGHGKIKRKRDVALAKFRAIVDGLYAGEGIEIPGAAAERRASSRQRVRWLVRVGDQVGYTRDVSRSGAAIELALGESKLSLEVIELDGKVFALDAEVTRRDATVTAVRWLGGAAELARRLPP